MALRRITGVKGAIQRLYRILALCKGQKTLKDEIFGGFGTVRCLGNGSSKLPCTTTRLQHHVLPREAEEEGEAACLVGELSEHVGLPWPLNGTSPIRRRHLHDMNPLRALW
jgi:hypothetical protein